jgi:nucleotide-binding universal stress UspA family protein
MYSTIIWATDGSAGADLALVEARALAQLCGARIVAVHCDRRLTGRAAEWPVLPDEDDRRARIREQVAELRAAGVDIDVVVRRSHRDAPDVVAAIAREHEADLIVCGTRGLGAVSGLVHGTFTKRLLHVAPCPVLAVTEPKAERPVAVAAREATHA